MASYFFYHLTGFLNFLFSFISMCKYLFNEKSAPTQEQVKGVGLSTTDKLPETLPSVVEIKRVLPKHCFEPKISTSLYYTIRDFIQVAILFYLMILFQRTDYFSTLKHLSWIPYWGLQGTFFTALFVIGHDCGHDSFSTKPWLNDLVGNITHGFLMAPYYMWKLTHRIHHKNTGNIDRDEVFYPVRNSEPSASSPVLPGFGFGIGWFGYILLGYKPREIPHFNLSHPALSKHLISCIASLFSMAIMATLLTCFFFTRGFGAFVCYYLVPLFIFASYTVIITFLHHNEFNIPWYSNDQWSNVRGQLSTIDRHYGIVHHLIHSIGTHQMHHMFTKIPHYRLEEATTAFRASFPHLVRKCDEPILPSFMRMFKKWQNQGVIKDNTKIHVYK